MGYVSGIIDLDPQLYFMHNLLFRSFDRSKQVFTVNLNVTKKDAAIQSYLSFGKQFLNYLWVF